METINWVITLGSVLLSIFYAIRFRRISSRVNYSNDLSVLTVAMIVVNIWNIILSSTNPIQLHYDDAYVFSLALVSTVIFRLFAKSIVNFIEFVTFKSAQWPTPSHTSPSRSDFSDLESNKKSVSFSDETTVFNYSDSKLSVEFESLQNTVVDDVKYYMKKLAKTTLKCLVIFVFCVMCVPESALLVSSKTLWTLNDDRIVIKTDHFLATMGLEFLMYMACTANRVLKNPRIKNAPFFTFVSTMFIWCYSSVLLLLSVNCLFLFNDIINILNLHDIYKLLNGNLVSIFSSKVILHALNCSTNDASVCNNMSEKFAMVQKFMTLSWSLMNFIYLGITPFLIWIIVVEMNVKRIRNT